MTFQSSANDRLMVNKFMVSETVGEGKYTSISSAITAAVADGASAANPYVILIKTGTYTENVTLADGIILKGQDDTRTISSVILTGSITLTTGTAKCESIEFERNGSDIFAISGGTLTLANCQANNNNADIFAFTTATNKTVINDKSRFTGTGTATLCSHDGNAATITFSAAWGGFDFAAPTIVAGVAGNFTCDIRQCHMTQAWDLRCPTVTFALEFCACQTIGGNTFITTNATATSGNVQLRHNTIDIAADTLFSIGHVGIIVINESCSIVTTSGFADFGFVASQEIKGGGYQVEGTASNSNNTGIMFTSDKTGYTNTEERKCQGFVQTTDATVTTIWTHTLSTNQGITIQAQVSGKKSDSTAYCGGNVVGCARRAAAGAILVGSSSNVLEDSAGAPTFVIDINGNDVRIRVTGIVAETWNWASTITYQRIEANT